MCQGLLSYRRHIGKREDPGDEVDLTVELDGFLNMRAQFGNVQGFMGVTCICSYPNPALSFMSWQESKITRTYKMLLPGFPRPLHAFT